MPMPEPPPPTSSKDETYLNYLSWIRAGEYSNLPEMCIEALAKRYLELYWVTPKRPRED